MSAFMQGFKFGQHHTQTTLQTAFPEEDPFAPPQHLTGLPTSSGQVLAKVKKFIARLVLIFIAACIAGAIWGSVAFTLVFLGSVALWFYRSRTKTKAQALTLITSLDPPERQRHSYIIGKTGSGKTTTLKTLILNDIKNNHGVIVLSPERAIFHDLLSHLYDPHLVPNNNGNFAYKRLVYFDPTDNTEPVVGFNPFHFDAPADPHERQHLLTQQAGETYTIFTRAMGDLGVVMSTLFQNCVYALLQRPNSTIRDLERLIDPRDNTLRQEIANDPTIDERTRRFWAQYQKSDYYKKAHAPVMNRLDPLFRPPLIDVLSVHSCSFQKFLNERPGSMVFCDLSGLRGIEKLIIGQLIIASVQQTLLRRDHMPESEHHPYYFYIDEFQELAGESEDAMRELMNRTRKYHVGLTLSHQISADLTSDLRSTIVGNVGTMIVMQTAAEDAHYFADQLQLHEYKLTDEGAYKLGRHMPELLQNLRTGEAYARTPRTTQPVYITIPATPDEFFKVRIDRSGVDVASEVKEMSKTEHGWFLPTPAPEPEPPAETPAPKKTARKTTRTKRTAPVIPLLDDDEETFTVR